MSRRQPTAQQRAAAELRRERFKELCAKVSELSEAQKIEFAANYSVIRADGSPLSAGNVCLVVAQCPTVPTIVAGFKQWAAMGRKIVSGPGSGLAIWCPTARKKSADESADEPGRKPGFIMGTVFDISQTALINEPADGIDYATAPESVWGPFLQKTYAADEPAPVALVAGPADGPADFAENGNPAAYLPEGPEEQRAAQLAEWAAIDRAADRRAELAAGIG